uniref:Peptidase A2 domain-containing protein n=1 Tax=uncultured bacterium contig00052 TaxID=1181536 RepID=A0A806KGT6_9BACT|nr:hypothetical protein [uncultured bacterium contig00052]
MKKHKAFTTNFDKIVFDITTELSIGNQNSASKKFMTVWDTGAQGSVITKKVAKILKLTHIGWTTIRGVTGKARAKIYFVDFILPNGVQIQTEVTSCDSLGNCDALIGMDIITLGDFSISNYGKKLHFHLESHLFAK